MHSFAAKTDGALVNVGTTNDLDQVSTSVNVVSQNIIGSAIWMLPFGAKTIVAALSRQSSQFIRLWLNRHLFKLPLAAKVTETDWHFDALYSHVMVINMDLDMPRHSAYCSDSRFTEILRSQF
jgi:hypothetical protein